jgi:DNA-binding CsgD family transcriptional regulator/tetratricopeptide (TPR) repeat protein
VTALLERDELLARLREAQADGGRLLFVGGEAGVGKTALMRSFAAQADGRVLRGACENLTTPTPLAPFADIAHEIGGALAATVAAHRDPREVALCLLDELDVPSVVVFEDVHWADQATLDALRVLGRRIDASPSLVVATYRDDEIEGAHPLRVVLGELASAPAVGRLSVPRLSLDAVRQLATPHAADGDAIHRLTRGNAFYVTEILAAGGEALPATVRDAVLARVTTGVPAGRGLLEAVAMVPARVELWLLEAVAPEELTHLDACLEAGVLGDDGGAVAFRHELARLAVESGVASHRRRALHAAILRALRPTGDVSRLAHHAEEAGDIPAVLEFAPEAARRAREAKAHREAAAQYARALRHADALPSAARASLLAAYGQEADVTGQYEASIAARLQAVELYHELGDPLSEGTTLSRLTIPYIRAGRNTEAEAASRRAIQILEGLPAGRELATAYADQAYARMLARDNAAGVAWGEKAVAAAEGLDDPDILSFGLNMVGTSYLMAGETDRGLDFLLRSLRIAQEEGLELRVYLALGMLGSGLGEMYELERAERYLHECIAFAKSHELTSWYPRAWLALVEAYRGRWDEGATRAHALLVQSPDAISRISALVALGRLRARRGDPGAMVALDEALELAQPGGHLQRLGHIHCARAEAAWLAGDPDRTVAEACTAYPLALEKRHLWFAGELVYWQRRGGLVVGAPEWIAPPYRLELGGLHRDAAAAWLARGCPYEAARALAEAGDEKLELEALAEFERLGAVPAATSVRRKLHARGVAVPRGPRPSTRLNPAALTCREIDVLRLVAAGKRNADVAAELVLSQRTVDHHVSAILRKLRVRTRGEAAAAAADLGLLQDR